MRCPRPCRSCIVYLVAVAVGFLLLKSTLDRQRSDAVVMQGMGIRRGEGIGRPLANRDKLARSRTAPPPLVYEENGETLIPGHQEKIILLWSPYNDQEFWDFGPGKQGFIEHECGVKTCQISSNKKDLHRADAVVFISEDTSTLPARANNDQRFVTFSLESPIHSAGNSDENVYNWTMSYRRDSDIWFPYEEFEWKRNSTVSEPDLPKDLTKRKNAVWLVSHCAASSNRDDYVRILQNSDFHVDIYGSCGIDLTNSTWEALLSEYRYYLAFENSLCPGYLTEKIVKLFVPNYVPTIPIYMGMPDPSWLFPSGVRPYIKTSDFRSPVKLAKYLNKLSLDEERLRQFFEWRTKWSWKLVRRRAFCRLCAKLNTPQPRRWYPDIRKWYDVKQCKSFDGANYTDIPNVGTGMRRV